MTTATKYNITVAWRSLAKDVFQLTRETVNAPATYRCTVSAVDTNNPGAGTKAIGYYMVDFWGVPYSIIGVSSTTVDIQDDFRVGRCPTSGQMAIIYQSVFSGRAQYLTPDSFRHLHPLAMDNFRRYESSLLYLNDPNAKKVPFTNIEYPSIESYQTDQTDPEDAAKTINYAEIYGDDPSVRCIIVLDENTSFQLQQMPQFVKTAGKLTRVWFDMTGNPSNGYLIISKG